MLKSINIFSLALPSQVTDILHEGEVARPCPGAHLVWATSEGDVITFTKGRARRLQPKRTQSKGYLQVRLKRDTGEPWRPCVHQVVALAFHGVPEGNVEDHEVHHKIENKHDNRPDNLEWETKTRHVQLTIIHNRTNTDLRHADVFIARCRARTESLCAMVTDLVARFGVTRETASRAIRGKSWKFVPQPDHGLNLDSLAEALFVSLEKAIELDSMARGGLFSRAA